MELNEKRLTPNLRLIFISRYDQNYSRSAVLLHSQTLGKLSHFIRINNVFIDVWKTAKFARKQVGHGTVFVVMSPSSYLTPILKLMTRRPIILDSGWPLLDGFNSRLANRKKIISRLKTYLIDFAAFNCASLILLESSNQKENVSKHFFVNKRKIAVSPTGFDESRSKAHQSEYRSENRYILFRGKINSEAGIQNIVKSFSQFLPDLELWIVTDKWPDNLILPSNVKLKTGRFSDDELSYFYSNAIVSIGQISSNIRLDRTVPHKAFESAYFGVPYISLRTHAMLEYFPDEECGVKYIAKADSELLANAIFEIAKSKEIREALSRQISNRYYCLLSQEIISENFRQLLIRKNYA